MHTPAGIRRFPAEAPTIGIDPLSPLDPAWNAASPFRTLAAESAARAYADTSIDPSRYDGASRAASAALASDPLDLADRLSRRTALLAVLASIERMDPDSTLASRARTSHTALEGFASSRAIVTMAREARRLAIELTPDGASFLLGR